MIASDIMTSPVYVVSPSENVAHARNLMLKHKISRLPVVQGARPYWYPYQEGYRLQAAPYRTYMEEETY